jgi:hypothetical protein
MAIEFAGSATSNTNEISFSADVGDLVFAAIVRDGSASAPSLGTSDVRVVSSTGGSLLHLMVVWFYAATESVVFGPVTDATRIAITRYKSDQNRPLIVTRAAVNNGSGTSVAWAGLLGHAGNLADRRVACVVCQRNNDGNLENVPVGLVNRVVSSGGTAKLAIHDTNSFADSFTGFVAVGGSGFAWRTATVAIEELEHVSVGGGAAGFTGIRGVSRRLGT